MDEKQIVLFKEIGDRLRSFALEGKKNGLWKSLKEFAERLEMTKGAMAPYYNGDSVLGGYKLYLLSKLGCDINWLLTGKGYEPASNKEEMKEKLKEMLDKL